uniref:Uncharacterized protein n=1 Tax=Arundo donax TaxID=35708 RepID=A0A0A9ARC0_ARUDO
MVGCQLKLLYTRKCVSFYKFFYFSLCIA